jgi:hypothetical protein
MCNVRTAAERINSRQNGNVTIGLCAGIPLQDAAGTSRHGAVFLLRNKAVVDAEVTLFDGWTTTVAPGTNAVVTRGPSSSTSFDETRTEALRAANNGLDYICMRGRGSAAIRIDSDDCLVWWPDPVNGVTLRARVIHTTRAQMRFTATVTNKDGTVVHGEAVLSRRWRSAGDTSYAGAARRFTVHSHVTHLGVSVRLLPQHVSGLGAASQ